MIRVLVIAAALVATACGPKGNATEPTTTKGLIKLTSNVREAEVYVDGRLIGRVGSLRGGVLMKPGVHRIELRHEGYFSAYAELEVGTAEKREMALEMAPILP